MITKANIQFVKGLQDKKQRQKYGQFTVEGEKSITELLKSNFTVLRLFALAGWIQENNGIIGETECTVVSERELTQISVHKAPQKALAVVKCPLPAAPLPGSRFVLGLDEIQDPGNLGTLIRIADWYGIQQIVCSPGSTDVYAPKCINATMGSFLRVRVHYGDIIEASEGLNLPLIVTAFDGQNIHKSELPEKGLVVIGNEGHGIAPALLKAASVKLTIPRFGGAESLNAAVSAAIVLDNLIR